MTEVLESCNMPQKIRLSGERWLKDGYSLLLDIHRLC